MDKVTLIKHKDIDLKKWDKAILSSKMPLVFAQSFYLNATSPKWDALVIGDYESVFPLTVKNKLGFKYLPQPSFTSQLGAFGKINDGVEMAFYRYITAHFKLIEIELNASNNLKVKGLSQKRTFIIDYKKEHAYNQNTKRNIKKAEENGFIVIEADAKESISLSKKIIDPFLEKEVGLSRSVIKTFNSLLANGLKNNQIITFKTVDPKKNVKAIGHFAFNNTHVLYLKGTNVDKKDNSGSMHLLIDFAIKYFEKKAKVFDFGGGGNTGLAGFYRGLGGSQLDYHFLKINRLPKVINVLKGKKS
ncbi:MAG: hypothetical protein JNJ40_15735 [Bacteroidia bacterium]|nr:hypothetical protein [Bacteroidia bacterium]